MKASEWAIPGSSGYQSPSWESRDPVDAGESLLPGLELGEGRFLLERCLGQGASRQVFTAYDRELECQVVLKMARLSGEPNRLLLAREFRVQRSICHPNVARALDLFEAGARPFFTMELREGEHFERAVRGGAPLRTRLDGCSEQGLRELLLDLVAGVEAIHQAHVVHGDLRSANVLVARASNTLAVVDFGLAQSTGEPLPCAGTWIPGSPAYMSPELLRGESPSEASDRYALGVMLYEALYGQLPFGAVAAQEPRAFPELPAWAPCPSGDLDRLCLALLAPAAAERPTLTEIRDVLLQGADGQAITRSRSR